MLLIVVKFKLSLIPRAKFPYDVTKMRSLAFYNVLLAEIARINNE